MFIIIFLIFITVLFVFKRKKITTAKKVKTEGDRLHLILQNVEAYDGSAKGQKRLEDIK